MAVLKENMKPPQCRINLTSSSFEHSTSSMMTPSQTPTRNTAEPISETTASLLDHQTPSLTELLSPYVTLTPVPPTFRNPEEENQYLRQRVAELVYTKNALTDRIMSLEKEKIELGESSTFKETATIAIQTDSILCSSRNINLTEEKRTTKTDSGSQTENSVEQNKNRVCLDKRLNDKSNKIHVINGDMDDMIDGLIDNKFIAFAHTISGDLNHHRQMSAGVAVVFEKRFGKPEIEDLRTNCLAYQETSEGAAIYSLITKPHFWDKPTDSDYDKAFEDLANDFQQRGFTTLVCSPMGCVRDEITLDHFIQKIHDFQKTTDSTVLIISRDHKARRVLRHGLSHPEFLSQLREKINKAKIKCLYKIEESNKVDRRNQKNHKVSDNAKPRTQQVIKIRTPWYKLEDNDIKLYLDHISVPENTLLLDPTVSHLLKNSNSTEDVRIIKEDLRINTFEYVLAVLNDREDDDKEGGVHWSLLLYTRQTNTYYHLDSLEHLNARHAEEMAARLSGDPSVKLIQVQCYRQEQTVECGAYALSYIDLICSRIRQNLPVCDDRCCLKKSL